MCDICGHHIPMLKKEEKQLHPKKKKTVGKSV